MSAYGFQMAANAYWYERETDKEKKPKQLRYLTTMTFPASTGGFACNAAMNSSMRNASCVVRAVIIL
jgi:hypothetical protein